MSLAKFANFEQELTALLNRYSLENDSDTPDWILAQYMSACLQAYNAALQERECWYDRAISSKVGHLGDVNGPGCDPDVP